MHRASYHYARCWQHWPLGAPPATTYVGFDSFDSFRASFKRSSTLAFIRFVSAPYTVVAASEALRFLVCRPSACQKLADSIDELPIMLVAQFRTIPGNTRTQAYERQKLGGRSLVPSLRKTSGSLGLLFRH